MVIPTRFICSGDVEKAKTLIGEGRSRLNQLLHSLSYNKIPTANPPPIDIGRGITIKCVVNYGLTEVYIHVPVTVIEEREEKEEYVVYIIAGTVIKRMSINMEKRTVSFEDSTIYPFSYPINSHELVQSFTQVRYSGLNISDVKYQIIYDSRLDEYNDYMLTLSSYEIMSENISIPSVQHTYGVCRINNSNNPCLYQATDTGILSKSEFVSNVWTVSQSADIGVQVYRGYCITEEGFLKTILGDSVPISTDGYWNYENIYAKRDYTYDRTIAIDGGDFSHYGNVYAIKQYNLNNMTLEDVQDKTFACILTDNSDYDDHEISYSLLHESWGVYTEKRIFYQKYLKCVFGSGGYFFWKNYHLDLTTDLGENTVKAFVHYECSFGDLTTPWFTNSFRGWSEELLRLRSTKTTFNPSAFWTGNLYNANSVPGTRDVEASYDVVKGSSPTPPSQNVEIGTPVFETEGGNFDAYVGINVLAAPLQDITGLVTGDPCTNASWWIGLPQYDAVACRNGIGVGVPKQVDIFAPFEVLGVKRYNRSFAAYDQVSGFSIKGLKYTQKDDTIVWKVEVSQGGTTFDITQFVKDAFATYENDVRSDSLFTNHLWAGFFYDEVI